MGDKFYLCNPLNGRPYTVEGSGSNITLTHYDIEKNELVPASTRPASPHELRMFQLLERGTRQVEELKELNSGQLLELDFALTYAEELGALPRAEREERLARIINREVAKQRG